MESLQRGFQMVLDFLAPPGVGRAEHSPRADERQAEPDATYAHPRANRRVHLQQVLVAYEFKRARRRSIGFLVGPDGLEVRAPRWVTLGEVEMALRERSAWIVRKLQEMTERQQRLASTRIEWKDGASFPFLGADVLIRLDARQGFAANTWLQEDVLYIGLPQQASAEQIRDAVQAWLMRQARRIFVERLDHFAPLLGVQWKKLSLSNAGTRWGSARSDGSIRLNWRLVHFRQAVIDYVVVHELSHLRVMDHSPRFWDAVRSVVPDYAELRSQLKDEQIPDYRPNR